MVESQFPADVKRFILEHISSIEMLEILLFLHSQPERFFSIEQVLKEIQSSRESIEQRLDQLKNMKLVVKREGQTFQFASVPPELKDHVDALKKCYSTWRLKVIEIIYSRPSDGITLFSDAFKFRKGK